MKATYLHLAGALTLTIAIAACIPSAEPPAPSPTPVAAPAPAPTPTPSPQPVQEPQYGNYLDAPQTAGTWEYQVNAGGPVAVFIGANGNGEFVMSCNRSRSQIDIGRAGISRSPRVMQIRTETATRSFTVVQAEDSNPYLIASVPARDAILDAMAITKGRFAVETEGLRTLYLPAWVEISRVIEDCR